MTHSEYMTMPHYRALGRGYFNARVAPVFARLKYPSRTQAYIIAGKHVVLRTYSPLLEDFVTHAFAHLSVPPTGIPIDLTIHVWEGVDNMDEVERADSVLQDIDNVNFFGGVLAGEDILNFYDASAGEAYCWVFDARALPDWAHAAPLRTILNWYFSGVGIYLVHGAVVGTQAGAVLLSARGGSGKSTTALSCVLAGMDYVGDDYVALEVQNNHVVAHSIYNSAKIVPERMHTFPELMRYVWNEKKIQKTDTKTTLFLYDGFAQQCVSSAPLHAVCIPSISTRTCFVPTTKVHALRALLPTTLFQLPLVRHAHMSALADIVDKTPCYILELGPDVRRVPDTIKMFLQ